jgi:hypothetical protein
MGLEQRTGNTYRGAVPSGTVLGVAVGVGDLVAVRVGVGLAFVGAGLARVAVGLGVAMVASGTGLVAAGLAVDGPAAVVAAEPAEHDTSVTRASGTTTKGRTERRPRAGTGRAYVAGGVRPAP